jgi:NAD(P)H-hydrate repair Nnr-like enzyme with NAD(P)H-hydrate dehydratase domain
LTLIARDDLLRAELHEACVLTPHEGEFKRLFPTLDLSNRAEAAQSAAKELGCTVLLKGVVTLIADPNGACREIDSTDSPTAVWLATAGSGDVLSGLVAGLLARGLGTSDAAEIAARLHILASEQVGPGLIAGDLPAALPRVFQDLGL